MKINRAHILWCSVVLLMALAPSHLRARVSVEEVGGKYWFRETSGTRFLSLGVNSVNPNVFQPRPNSRYYDPIPRNFGGNEGAWRDWTVNLLKGASFNTFASWSYPKIQAIGFYHTPCLYVAGHAANRCLEGFRPDFEDEVRRNAQAILSAYPNNEELLGAFLDNEMPWFGKSGWDRTPTYTLLELAFEQPAEHPAHKAAREFLEKRHKTAEAFRAAWGGKLADWNQLDSAYMRHCDTDESTADRNAFVRLAAEKFFEPSARVCRELTSGALVLGVRFAGYAPEPVVEVCGKHCDVVSVNNYQPAPAADSTLLTKFWMWGHKPLMITEYSWRAEQNTSGDPNTRGAGAVVKTQADRAKNYTGYVGDLLSYPMVVGAHWFEFADQSPQGRFDGEDSNYGIVDIENRPYTELLAEMAKTNAAGAAIHESSRKPLPTQLPPEPKAIYQPGQHPDRPAVIELLKCTPIQPDATFHAADASITATRTSGTLVLDFKSGNQWGCGVTLFGPKECKAASGPDYATDLDGYSQVIVDAELPEGVRMQFFVDEAGSREPNAPAYDNSAGDDGESYKAKPVVGTGKRQRYVIDLTKLEPRTDFGNQRGRHIVDMQALKGFALLFGGSQDSGQAIVYDLELQR